MAWRVRSCFPYMIGTSAERAASTPMLTTIRTSADSPASGR